jgi:hypothetical protein
MLLVLDLIGAAALVAALTFGILFIWQLHHQMKRMDD